MKSDEIKVGKIYTDKKRRPRRVIKITPPNTYVGWEVHYCYHNNPDHTKPDGVISLSAFAQWAKSEVREWDDG